METPNTLKSKFVCRTPDGSDSKQSRICGSRTRTPLSASLKERLKRTRRSFNSPFSVAKRLKVDSDEEAVTSSDKTENVGECADGVDLSRNQIARKSCPEDGIGGSRTQRDLSADDSSHNPQIDLFHLREKLKKDVRDKTERLQRLKMAQMYRTKNDPTQLQFLIDKWRSCSQAVLLDLQTAMLVDGRKASISQLIDNFGLDDAILHFDRTEDYFRDL